MTEGIVFDIQRYSLHDGPGLRTLVFLKGCPLRCEWCSNPESQLREPELLYDAMRCTACGDCVRACPTGALSLDGAVVRYSRADCNLCGACASACIRQARSLTGTVMSDTEVVESVMRDAPFYRRSGGGVTLGGGEPTYQPRFATGILQELRLRGVHTAIETCGHTTAEAFQAVTRLTDLVLFDVKHAESASHARLTGTGNELILRNLESLLQADLDITIRYPLIPGRNDGMKDLLAFRALLCRLARIPAVEFIPYHRLGEHKYRLLGRDYALAGVSPCGEEIISRACTILQDAGIDCSVIPQ